MTHGVITERSMSDHGTITSGREGKGREGNRRSVLHAFHLTLGATQTPRAPHRPAHRPPMQQSQIGGWLG